MDASKVGSFIAMLRKEKGMTQQELADRLNVTNKAVSKWETGDGYPETTMLPVLADAIGITVDELLRGERGRQQCMPDLDLQYLKFRNRSLISMALAVFGIFVFYSIQFTPLLWTWLGFGLFLFFLLSSITLSLIASNEMKTSLSNARQDKWSKEAALRVNIERQWIKSVYFWCAVLLLVLPYALIPGQSFVNYINMLPIFLVVGGLLAHQVITHLYKDGGLDSMLGTLSASNGAARNTYMLYNLISLCFGIALCGVGVLPLIVGEPMPYFTIYRDPYFLMVWIILFLSFSVVFAIKNSGRLFFPVFVLIAFRNLFVPCILAGELASTATHLVDWSVMQTLDEIYYNKVTSWLAGQIDWPKLLYSVAYAAALYGGLTVWVYRIRRVKLNQ